MGFLKQLFNLNKKLPGSHVDRKPRGPYVDNGLELVGRLTTTLGLTDWKGSSPICYTDVELTAINSRISGFQQQANQAGGEGKVFVVRSEFASEMQGMFAASALQDLASDSWKYSDNLPVNWKEFVSSYLKSWVAGYDPMCLIDLGDLLIKADHNTEAREVFKLLLLFPTHAPSSRSWQSISDQVTATAKKRLENLS